MLRLMNKSIFKRPVNSDSLDAWCKILDDISKVAILSTPVVLYSDNTFSYKIFNAIFLTIAAYSCLHSADFMRRNKNDLIKNQENIMALTVGLGIMALLSVILAVSLHRSIK